MQGGAAHQHISVPQLLLHFGALLLYLIATVWAYYEYCKFVWTDPAKRNVYAYFISVIATNWISMVSLLLMAAILYPITRPEEPQPNHGLALNADPPNPDEPPAEEEEEEEIADVVVTDFDDEAESEMRIWFLFARGGDRAALRSVQRSGANAPNQSVGAPVHSINLADH